MRWFLFLCGFVLLLMQEVTCPPVQPDVKPVEGDSPDDIGEDDTGFGLEYDRYLREIVMALEEDEAFRKKLEEMNMTDIKGLGLEYDRYLSEVISVLEQDETFRKKLETLSEDEIKNGKIAKHLDLVSHQIRERLDEIKRQEMNRLRELAREKMKQMKGMDVLGSVAKYGGIQRMDEAYLHHVDVKNPHSFEASDLEKLIKKATNDLDEIDKKRRNEFKTYEMEKEHQRREELKNLDEEHRKAREEEFERMKKRHEDHPKVHHPGSKDQLEDVWEKTDNMEAKDFDPKTFFKMHDLNGDGFLDQDEVEALFQKELDQVYDPNLPEDDMRERYEDMARMREHVFGELDQDKDRLISLDEFLNYTSSQEFQKDEGWKTVDEEQNFTDEEYQRYEKMLREHEERMRAQGLDPNMAQPGMVPLGQDPNVQHMQMPQGGPGMPQGMHQQQQQQFHQQQFQQQQQFNQQHGQQQQQFNQQHGQQQQFQQHEQQQQMRQMGQMQGHAPVGQGQMHGGPVDMGGHMAGGQQGMGQQQMHGGPPGMGQPQMHGGPPGMIQGQGGQMPPGHMPRQGGGHIPRPPPEEVDVGQDQNVHAAEVPVNQGVPVMEGEGQTQGSQGERQNNQNQDALVHESQGQEPQKDVAPVDLGAPVQNDIEPESQGQQGQKVVLPVDLGDPGQGQVQPKQGQGQNIDNNKNVIKAKALGQPSPEKLSQSVQDGMPPVQGQVPHHQQMNAQQQGQGQDTLKFQGQGHQEQQKQEQQPLV